MNPRRETLRKQARRMLEEIDAEEMAQGLASQEELKLRAKQYQERQLLKKEQKALNARHAMQSRVFKEFGHLSLAELQKLKKEAEQELEKARDNYRGSGRNTAHIYRKKIAELKSLLARIEFHGRII